MHVAAEEAAKAKAKEAKAKAVAKRKRQQGGAPAPAPVVPYLRTLAVEQQALLAQPLQCLQRLNPRWAYRGGTYVSPEGDTFCADSDAHGTGTPDAGRDALVAAGLLPAPPALQSRRRVRARR